ncbi:MAG: hypothetical protein AAFU63_09630 [Pseudomonadota bacterium]
MALSARHITRRGLRACAVLCGLGFGSVVSAQSLDVPKSFSVFDRFCRPALQGLEQMKAVLTVPGPAGEKVYAVSPDGNYITVQTAQDDFIIVAEFRYGPGFVARNCLVQQLVAQPIAYETVDAAFQAARWTGPDIVMTGGEVLEEVPAVGAMRLGGTGNITRPRAGYLIYGATEPAGSLVQAITGQGVFTLTGFFLGPR